MQDENFNLHVWDKVFKEQGYFFNESHESIDRVVTHLEGSKSKRLLDLGCGTGRHVIHFAKEDYDVYGMDTSTTALELSQKWLDKLNLSANLQTASMTEVLPYESNYFDAVISVQVIHHGRLATIQQVISEVKRVIKPNGILLITVPAVKNQGKTYEEIEPNTFVPLDGIEKGMPHHYFTEQSLREAFHNFNILDITVDKVEHFCLIAQYPDATN